MDIDDGYRVYVHIPTDTGDSYVARADISAEFLFMTLFVYPGGSEDKHIVVFFAFDKIRDAIIKCALIATHGWRKYTHYEYIAQHGKTRRIRKKYSKKVGTLPPKIRRVMEMRIRGIESIFVCGTGRTKDDRGERTGSRYSMG